MSDHDLTRKTIQEGALLDIGTCGREGCDKPLMFMGALYCGAGCVARVEGGAPRKTLPGDRVARTSRDL